MQLFGTITAAGTSITVRPSLLRKLQVLGESTIVSSLAKADSAAVPSTQSVLPLDVVAGTRGYFSSVAVQANGCYEHGWYDAAAVMVRKLIESLIVETYEGKGQAGRIKSATGDFLMLGDLIDRILAEPSWNLSRETKVVLPKIKALGDRAAHNRRFVARKPDVDAIVPGLRVAVDDLLHLSGLRERRSTTSMSYGRLPGE